jgi:hypothetical protein
MQLSVTAVFLYPAATFARCATVDKKAGLPFTVLERPGERA